MSFEEEYFDVLHSIEFAIVQTYRENPTMKDRHAESAIKGLVRYYNAALSERKAPTIKLNELEKTMFDAIKTNLELHMSVQGLVGEGRAYTIEEVIACLKRIQKSINTWSKTQGYGLNTSGYLEFVKDYIAKTK